MLFPLASYFPHWNLLGFDFSQNAINIVNKRASDLNISGFVLKLLHFDYLFYLVNTEVFDLTTEPSTNSSIHDFPKADILALIFVLSAIAPEKHECAVKNLKRFLSVGSSIIIRDYGAFDHAMLRFRRGTKIGDRFYTRQDGTRVYFFKKG